MGVNTDYLEHVGIVPSMNQAEYDYLHAFARGRRSYRPGGPDAVGPEDPHTGSSNREVELHNQIAGGPLLRTVSVRFQSCPSNATSSHHFCSARGPFATSCGSSTGFT